MKYSQSSSANELSLLFSKLTPVDKRFPAVTASTSTQDSRVSRSSSPDTAHRAAGLFRFLAEAQRLRTHAVHTVDGYTRAELSQLLWLHHMPEHDAITIEKSAPDEPFLKVSRVPSLPIPTPPMEIVEMVSRWDDQYHEPSIFVPEEYSKDARVLRQEIYAEWLPKWRAWSLNAVVMDLYSDLFKASVTVKNHSEEYELVLGVGLLKWSAPGFVPVNRHMFTTPARIQVDEDSGDIRVESAHDRVASELRHFVDPAAIARSDMIADLEEAASRNEGNPLAEDGLGDIARRLTNLLDARGEFHAGEGPAPSGEGAQVSLTPALILRQRNPRALLEMFESISEKITATGNVPAGLVPLVDPDCPPPVVSDSRPGAMVKVGADSFLPLPLNDVQRSIVERVDRNAQVVVQGPPGTGKTHTIAALLSHLLAQGKRVLVTAHTDRALLEVRSKLPAGIRPLAVSLTGNSRDDMGDLKQAVHTLAQQSQEDAPDDREQSIGSAEACLDRLARERAVLHHDLVEARQQETVQREFHEHSATLAQHIANLRSEEATHDWILQYVGPRTQLNGTNSERLAKYRDLLQSTKYVTPGLGNLYLGHHELPAPKEFAEACRTARIARNEASPRRTSQVTRWLPFVRDLSETDRQQLGDRLSKVNSLYRQLERSSEQWMPAALRDLTAGQMTRWLSLASSVSPRLETCDAALSELGHTTGVEISGSDWTLLEQLAESVLTHVRTSPVKVIPTGQPKMGPFSPKAIKMASPLFEQVRVDGRVPTTPETLIPLVAWFKVQRLLRLLDEEWYDLAIPRSGTIGTRTDWHRAELATLRVLLSADSEMSALDAHLRSLEWPVLDWTEMREPRGILDTLQALPLLDAADATQSVLDELYQVLDHEVSMPQTSECLDRMRRATESDDPNLYAEGFATRQRLLAEFDDLTRREELKVPIACFSPHLEEDLRLDPDHWDSRIADFDAAWEWAELHHWLEGQGQSKSTDRVRDSLHRVDAELTQTVEVLAAHRAWSFALEPSRLSQSVKADLQSYVQLVRGLGKGTGKYAPRIRADIRSTMNRCRKAVPVWIMPIYRIAEQFDPEEDLFDVVIVDEASQAGVDAIFLQYLAPRIVVVGDDKQVSPAAVGQDRQRLYDLANEYIPDNPHKSHWSNPERSLFDEATMRFGNKLVLKEHRRCVPDIIGFSNSIAYEPEGLRLVPVRQPLAGQFPPIKTVFANDGYHTQAKTNPVEADLIVKQIQRCFKDPRYAGLTFGVISLQGSAQSQLIEGKLLDKVSPEEWTRRELRCGDASAFQGSERDVIFLSMVAASGESRSIALTRELYVQRYNVAVSRAKDQLWLFHSLSLTELNNPEDLRFKLLDYCLGVQQRQEQSPTGVPAQVPDDERVEPFDSLFEQRVFNKIIDRGYIVKPQVETQGYRIDLVIQGHSANLAVECDGDHWHGPAEYERDFARQRDLERCGWDFCRIRQSQFVSSPADAMEPLWEKLAALNIHPSGVVIQAPVSDLEPPGTEDSIHEWDEPSEAPQPPAEPATAFQTFNEPDQPTDTDQAPPRSQVTNPEEPKSARFTRRWLEPYSEFQGAAPVPDEHAHRAIELALLDIIGVEGPATGYRLQRAYASAAGIKRIGHIIRGTLNQALTNLAKSDDVLVDRMRGTRDPREHSYRLGHQPEVLPRELGPRPLEQVPLPEIAIVLDRSREQLRHDASDEEVYRELLRTLGITRLTQNAMDILRRADRLD